MSNYKGELAQIKYELPLSANNKEIYDCLHRLTDNDYNGNNGEEYHMTFTSSTGSKRMARLEEAMTHLGEYDELTEFIDYVIGDCYFDPYYKDFLLTTTVIYDTIVIVLSYVN